MTNVEMVVRQIDCDKRLRKTPNNDTKIKEMKCLAEITQTDLSPYINHLKSKVLQT